MTQAKTGIEFRDGRFFTAANQGEPLVTSELVLEGCIHYAIRAHGSLAKEGCAVRKFDGKTPAVTHLLDCWTEILNEPRLSEGDRAAGSLALLFHDVIQDTTVPPPDFLSPRVLQLVQDMTYKGGTEEEMVHIWEKEPFVILLKLYVKYSNWKTMGWATEAKKTSYRDYIQRLIDAVVLVYGPDLNVVRAAQALIR